MIKIYTPQPDLLPGIAGNLNFRICSAVTIEILFPQDFGCDTQPFM